jgi:hypothetical protein
VVSVCELLSATVVPAVISDVSEFVADEPNVRVTTAVGLVLGVPVWLSTAVPVTASEAASAPDTDHVGVTVLLSDSDILGLGVCANVALPSADAVPLGISEDVLLTVSDSLSVVACDVAPLADSDSVALLLAVSVFDGEAVTAADCDDVTDIVLLAE